MNYILSLLLCIIIDSIFVQTLINKIRQDKQSLEALEAQNQRRRLAVAVKNSLKILQITRYFCRANLYAENSRERGLEKSLKYFNKELNKNNLD